MRCDISKRQYLSLIISRLNGNNILLTRSIDGDFENLAIGTENGINIYERNDLDVDHKFYSFSSSITALCIYHEYLAVAEKSGEVTLWNLINRKRETSIIQQDSLGFSSLRFFQDDYLIGSALNGNIYIYNFKTNILSIPTARFRSPKIVRQTTIQLHKVIHGHNLDIFTMIKINNNIFATGSTDHSIKIWDISTFKCIKVIKGHSLDVLCLASNHEFLWSGSMDKTIKSIFT